MQLSRRIHEDTEKPFRKALDHASQRSTGELHSTLEQLTQEQLEGAVGLCGLVSAYVAINAVKRRWPTDGGLRHMAMKTVEGENQDEQYGVTEQNVYRWLSKCVLGFEAYAEVFDGVFGDPRELTAAPFFFTINLLARFHPKDESVTEFLDRIEAAYEGAWLLDLNLLPALMVRARMPQPDQASSADATGK